MEGYREWEEIYRRYPPGSSSLPWELGEPRKELVEVIGVG